MSRAKPSLRHLGILAGGGDLPARVAAQAVQDGWQVTIIALDGNVEGDWADAYPRIQARMGAAGQGFRQMRAAGISDVIFAGRVRRPSLREMRPDWTVIRFFARLGLGGIGDDVLLRAAARECERQGFRLLAVQDILHDGVMPPGLFSTKKPDAVAIADIRHGFTVAHALGTLDVGQAVVVQQGIVLAVEAVEGTDAMLSRCAGVARAGVGGVLVKAKKPQQDSRFDLPTIGVQTVENIAAAGLRGIAVEAGGALVVDLPAVAEAANRLGVFVTGWRHDTVET